MSTSEDGDLNFLRQIAAHSISVYDAFRRAGALSDEERKLLTQAEELLCQAGLSYLVGSPEPDSLTTAITDDGVIVQFAASYTETQVRWANLQDALYALGVTHLESQHWGKARAVLQALAAMESGYRDVNHLVDQSYLDEASDLLAKRKRTEIMILLNAELMRDNTRQLIKRNLLGSFVDEALAKIPKDPSSLLFACSAVEPSVGLLPSFLPALDSYMDVSTAEFNVSVTSAQVDKAISDRINDFSFQIMLEHLSSARRNQLEALNNMRHILRRLKVDINTIPYG